MNYKLYLQTYNNTIRQAKHNYFRQKLDDNKDNVKNTWTILKSLINKENDKSTFPQAFFIDNNYTSNKKNIADGFNTFYSTIGMETQQSVPNCNKHFSDYLNNQSVNSIFIDLVDDNELVNIVSKFKPKMSSGHDGMPTKLVKLSIFSILSPLKHLINLSLLTGIFPSDLKIARVMPIYKSADKDQLKNYRPISLLPAFSKVFEKVMYNKIMNYFDSNNLFYQHQYGFRPNVQLSMSLTHNILIRKLDHYGIRGIAKTWMVNYLTNRKQYVEFSEEKSDHCILQCGVSQGSILGPLLYLIYINDIAACSD